MNKKELFNLTDVRNKEHYEPFDLSQNRQFSHFSGGILPIQCLEVVPGDKLQVNVSSLTRTLPLNSPAITRGKEHFNFHFVPSRLLWRFYPDFAIQNSHSDSAQSVRDSSVPTVVPTFSISDLRQNLWYLWNGDYVSNDIFGKNNCYTIVKLLEQLGYGSHEDVFSLPDVPSPSSPDLLVSILPLLAYQKIYQDFYRNSQWEEYDATSFNVDYMNSVSSSLDANQIVVEFDESEESCNVNLFKMRYANFKKDLFFGMRPNTQFGEVSVVNVEGKDFTYDGSTYPLGAVEGANGDTAIGSQAAQFNVSEEAVKLRSQFDILSLRRAEAIQRLREIQQATDFRYNSQIDRRFGFRVPDARAQMAEYIGGFDNVLQITDVTATSEGTAGDRTSVLGQLAGKGTMASTSQNTIKYEVKEHGYFICTYYISKEVNYPALGIDKQNLHLTFEDILNPEFENIGLESVNLSQLIWSKAVTEGENPNRPLGYVPRYMEYKQQIDKVYDQFKPGGSLDFWNTALDYDKLTWPIEYGQITWPFFKIPPSAFDSIMLFAYNEDQTVNPFLLTVYFDIRMIRNLTVSGLPNWHKA